MSSASPPLGPGDHLMLVDGSAYIFRAYHALPPLTRKSDGLPIGAVSGFCNMMWKLISDPECPPTDGNPSHAAVVFDASSHTFRNDLYADYKANRSEPPEDLTPQFGLIREATRAFGLPALEQEGFEADDLIATYARLAREAGAKVTIISSDKDLMQLLDDQVVMYDQMKDLVIDSDAVEAKFGVRPAQMIDMQALAGDTSDNVPGVPGIGPKTASQLLSEFGTLEALLEGAPTIKQNKRRESLIAHADQARLSKRLVTLDENVPLAVPVEDLAADGFDGPKAIAFLKAMEISTLTRRIAEATDSEGAEVAAAKIEVEGWKSLGATLLDDTPGATAANGARGLLGTPADLAAARERAMRDLPVDTSAYETVTTLERLDAWIAESHAAGRVAVDTETTSLSASRADLVGVSLCVEPGRACYVPIGHKSGNEDLLGGGLSEGQLALGDVLARLKPLLEHPATLKIGQNLKYDWLVLNRHGIDVAPYDDTMLISYALDAGKGAHGMDHLSRQWLGHEPIAYKEVAGTGKNASTFDFVPIDRATAYAAEDADVTLRLWLVLKPRLPVDGMASVYERLERPMVPVLARMEGRGIHVDRDTLSRISGDLAQKAAAVEAEIYEMAGSRFNIGSTKQLGDVMFERMKVPGGRKTRSGGWATGAEILNDLAEQGHEFPGKIVQWRQLTKLKSTYTDTLPEHINPATNRVHTSFSLASTTTGRLSSSEPNLQNIPARTEVGQQIRRAFVAEEGMRLISADYSQIELRVLAHVADVPQLRQAFADGVDIHATVASEMFGVPLEGLDPMLRRQAKTINFGIIYGISAYGLATRLSMSREEAGAYIRAYFERFPGIREYIEETKRFAHQHGYVETVFGRRAHYPEINTKDPNRRAFYERAAINAPIQGAAADIIRRAMIRIEDALARSRSSARMLLQVHDELIFEAPEDEAEDAIPTIRQVMIDAPNPAVQLAVPLEVDARTAANWEEAH